MKKLLLLLAICSSILVGCKDDKDKGPKLNFSEITMNSLDTKLLTVEGASGLTFETSNIFVANIDHSGLITAYTIGDATITVKMPTGDVSTDEVLTCKVTVKPRYQLHQEPITEFKASKETIKSKEKRVLTDEQPDALIYNDTKAERIVYVFDENGLQTCGSVFPLNFDIKALTDFLKERYIYLGEDTYGRLIMINEGVAVALSVETYGILAMYIPHMANSNASAMPNISTPAMLTKLNANQADVTKVNTLREQIKTLIVK